MTTQIGIWVILSADTLFGSSAFSVYKNYFYNDVLSDDDLCLIREKQNCSILRRFFGHPQGRSKLIEPFTLSIKFELRGALDATPSPARTPSEELQDETNRRGREADRIDQLPESEQAAAWETERLRRDQFLRRIQTLQRAEATAVTQQGSATGS